MVVINLKEFNLRWENFIWKLLKFSKIVLFRELLKEPTFEDLKKVFLNYLKTACFLNKISMGWYTNSLFTIILYFCHGLKSLKIF